MLACEGVGRTQNTHTALFHMSMAAHSWAGGSRSTEMSGTGERSGWTWSPELCALTQEVLSQCDLNAQGHGDGEISWAMRDPLARLG